MAGDFGFDPLGLGEDPQSLKWYVQAELVHARFAMAGVAGILFTDVSSTKPSSYLSCWWHLNFFLFSSLSLLKTTAESRKHLLDRAKKLTQECGKQDMILSIYIFKLNTDHSIAIWLLSRDKRDTDDGNRCDMSLFIFYFEKYKNLLHNCPCKPINVTSFIYTSLLLTI